MIVVMKKSATDEQLNEVLSQIKIMGFKTHVSRGVERVTIGVIGHDRNVSKEKVQLLPGVEQVIPILKPFKLVSREFQPNQTLVPVNGYEIGKGFVVIAGPCSVESRSQILETAHFLKENGANILRGGAFKPRTSPYSFQGLGLKALEYMAEAKVQVGLPLITEVISAQDVQMVADYVDILQIGARNMQNFTLLRAVGKVRKPILLKRGMMSTIEEFLLAAEYIMNEGNSEVILAERGIRTFETYTRNTLDLGAVPLIKELSHLPIIVDPSHATGKRSLVAPLAKAALAVGADGVMVEVHPDPKRALSDGPQSLTFKDFEALMHDIREIARALHKDDFFREIQKTAVPKISAAN
ncbi:phospho-2-dehydro-3-deoxyheptonate aldolase [bacterium BMS3Abin05]|nr:phospho-2-dehydro-3-deoxyheptonate aldolase [bacterium BMS3Abin05]GBE26576.1 phospho-2-dehydro-3-deoxyheptonate aldolase [bacterium BMS3Bbin03]HDK35611.1 3-deoxy-7-phosphoheptulonate synthase [Bacteroidota bacterium]HDL78442.1 3-deoxy-7-phosphoheptulonate synthase [Bacteroidota bacterium]HDZ10699.1 3-deoxy-7-phosphoheptulonate synthase [Bacteroidota bacterium]